MNSGVSHWLSCLRHWLLEELALMATHRRRAKRSRVVVDQVAELACVNRECRHSHTQGT